MSERDKNAAVKRNSPAREIWRRFKKNKAAMLGLGIFSVMVLLAVFADVICDYDTQVIAQDVANRLKAPNSFLDSVVNSSNIYRTFLSLVIKNKISL